MAKDVEEKVINNGENANTSNNSVTNTECIGMDHHEICTHLIANGASVIKSSISGVTIDDEDEDGIIANITLKNAVTLITATTETTTKTIRMYVSSLLSILREDDDMVWLATVLKTEYKLIPIIFAGAKIEVIQQIIGSGEEFVNPFTTKAEPKVYAYAHAVACNYVKSIEFSKRGMHFIDAIDNQICSGIKL